MCLCWRALSIRVFCENLPSQTFSPANQDAESFMAGLECSSGGMTPFGAAIRLNFTVAMPPKNTQLSDSQTGQLREKVVEAWIKNFTRVYTDAADAQREFNQQSIEKIEAKLKKVRDRTEELTRELIANEKIATQVDDDRQQMQSVERQLFELRARLEQTQAKRMAIEEQIDKSRIASEKEEAVLVRHLAQALELKRELLANVEQLHAQGVIHRKEVLAAQGEVMQAEIAIEQAKKDAFSTVRLQQRMDALQNITATIREIEIAYHSLTVPRDRLQEQGDHVAGSKFRILRMDVDLSEQRMHQLSDKLLELQDAEDNLIMPISFIPLAKYATRDVE